MQDSSVGVQIENDQQLEESGIHLAMEKSTEEIEVETRGMILIRFANCNLMCLNLAITVLRNLTHQLFMNSSNLWSSSQLFSWKKLKSWIWAPQIKQIRSIALFAMLYLSWPIKGRCITKHCTDYVPYWGLSIANLVGGGKGPQKYTILHIIQWWDCILCSIYLKSAFHKLLHPPKYAEIKWCYDD